MKIYPYTINNVSPDALRSSFSPARLHLGRVPQRTNLSHDEKISGWCGATGDQSVTARGELDTAAPNWLERLERLADAHDATVNRDELDAWLADESADDLTLAPDTRRESPGMTWDEGAEDERWYPAPRRGWMFIASYDEELVLPEGMSKNACDAVIGDDSVTNVAKSLCDDAGIDYDYQCHDTYNASTCGTDWAYVAIREADADRYMVAAANRALKATR